MEEVLSVLLRGIEDPVISLREGSEPDSVSWFTGAEVVMVWERVWRTVLEDLPPSLPPVSPSLPFFP